MHIRWMLGLMAVFCLAAFGQAAAPAFEVASVKLNQSGEVKMAVDFQAGGKFTATNVPLRILIALAYHVRPDQVTGGAGWIGSTRYDVVAKGSEKASQDELRRMAQSLLAERFKLVAHKEDKLQPAFALEVAKGGSKLEAVEGTVLSESRCVPGQGEAGLKHVVCRHLTMALLADSLQEMATRDLDVPVVDQTGLKGSFNFKLDWTPGVSPSAPPPDGLSGPTLFEAVEAQLGLKLQRTRLPLPVLVVDSVERLAEGN